ncbi:MAG: hypothetical protein AAGI11_17605 [Pseudomonadota bacterium]
MSMTKRDTAAVSERLAEYLEKNSGSLAVLTKDEPKALLAEIEAIPDQMIAIDTITIEDQWQMRNVSLKGGVEAQEHEQARKGTRDSIRADLRDDPEYQFKEPVLLCLVEEPVTDTAKLVPADGFTRIEAAVRAGRTEVRARVAECDWGRAMVLSRYANLGNGRRTPPPRGARRELAWQMVVTNYCEDSGKMPWAHSASKIASTADIGSSSVDRMVALRRKLGVEAKTMTYEQAKTEARSMENNWGPDGVRVEQEAERSAKERVESRKRLRGLREQHRLTYALTVELLLAHGIQPTADQEKAAAQSWFHEEEGPEPAPEKRAAHLLSALFEDRGRPQDGPAPYEELTLVRVAEYITDLAIESQRELSDGYMYWSTEERGTGDDW